MSCFFFFSSRRRHTRWNCDWSSDVCSSDLGSLHLTRGTGGRNDHHVRGGSLSSGLSLRVLVSHGGSPRRRSRGNPGRDGCRSEERRVGKECKFRRAASYLIEKMCTGCPCDA